jgi:hypothetical protein
LVSERAFLKTFNDSHHPVSQHKSWSYQGPQGPFLLLQ